MRILTKNEVFLCDAWICKSQIFSFTNNQFFFNFFKFSTPLESSEENDVCLKKNTTCLFSYFLVKKNMQGIEDHKSVFFFEQQGLTILESVNFWWKQNLQGSAHFMSKVHLGNPKTLSSSWLKCSEKTDERICMNSNGLDFDSIMSRNQLILSHYWFKI